MSRSNRRIPRRDDGKAPFVPPAYPMGLRASHYCACLGALGDDLEVDAYIRLSRRREPTFAGADPRDFPDLERAAAHAKSMLEAQARRGAIDAGAGGVELSFERDDNVAVVEGRETLVESMAAAVASGRPRFAAG